MHCLASNNLLDEPIFFFAPKFPVRRLIKVLALGPDVIPKKVGQISSCFLDFFQNFWADRFILRICEFLKPDLEHFQVKPEILMLCLKKPNHRFKPREMAFEKRKDGFFLKPHVMIKFLFEEILRLTHLFEISSERGFSLIAEIPQNLLEPLSPLQAFHVTLLKKILDLRLFIHSFLQHGRRTPA